MGRNCDYYYFGHHSFGLITMNEAPVQQPKKGGKIWHWILTIILIIVAALLGYTAGQNAAVQPTVSVEKATTLEQNYGDVPPEIFPQDFPFEVGTLLVQSLEKTDKETGITHASVAYYSQKSIQENADKFIAYLNQNGWTVVNNTNSNGVYNIYATKSRNSMSIQMFYEEGGGGLKVQVVYTVMK